MGIRCADHVTPLYPQKLVLTSPTGGGRSVCIGRSRTKATDYRGSLEHHSVSDLTWHESLPPSSTPTHNMESSSSPTLSTLRNSLGSCCRVSESLHVCMGWKLSSTFSSFFPVETLSVNINIDQGCPFFCLQRTTTISVGWFTGRTIKNQSKCITVTNRLNCYVIC